MYPGPDPDVPVIAFVVIMLYWYHYVMCDLIRRFHSCVNSNSASRGN